MVTEYDKAIAAFLSSTLAILAIFHVNVSWASPAVIGAIAAFAVPIITWLVPNKPAVTPTAPPVPSAGSQPVSGVKPS